MSTPKFANTYNLVAFLEKPEESNGFEEIINFLNASSVQYALTVNPTIYTSCIKQFWATTKVKTVNGEHQLQTLVDKKVIITETSIRTSEDGKRKIFFGRVTPLFATMMVQANQEEGADSATPTDSHSTPIITQPSSSKPQKKKSSRKQRKDSAPTKSTTEETTPEENVATPSCDPPQSGEDRMKLIELMNLCTQLQSRVLALETTKSNQALEIESLKRRVKSLEKRRKSRTPGFKRLRKVGSASRVESSNDASLGAQEDASKQGRKIADLDADAEVTLVDETQEMNDDNLMFDTDVLEEQEKDVAEKEVSAADPVTTAGEVVTTANVEVTTVNAPTTTIDELTLAQTLIEIKAAKPKAVTSAATTTTTTRPKARGVVVQEPSEFKTTSSSLQASQLPQAKDKGKGIMVEPEVPLKKKDQVALDEEMARNLEAQLQAELIEEERIARQKEEEANIALLESWDNTQAMMDADFQLAQQMQTEEQEQLSIEEKSKLFVELLEKRKKHFAALRAQEKRSKPPTKAQKRNTMSTYLKNMAGYKHNQLKSKSYDEIQEMFDKEMKRVNTFVDMNTELVKGSKTKAEGSSKRAGDELEQEKAKKQKGDNDQEEAEMKRHIEIVKDDEVAIDVIPLATKLLGIDREDLETLWKLVKAKHENTRPKDDYERVLWGDLNVMFKLDIKNENEENILSTYYCLCSVSAASSKVNVAGLAARVEGLGPDVENYGLDDEGRGLYDEGHSVESHGLGLEEEEEAVLGGQQEASLVVGTAVSAPLGLGYGALRRQELALEEDHVYSTFETLSSLEWTSGSLPISPSPFVVPLPVSSPLTVPSPVVTPAVVETKGFLTELGAEVEMQRGLIHDHTVRLEELSLALFERYDRDIGELFTRSGAVGQTDAQRATLWHTISDMQGENQDLQLQLVEERRARLELAMVVDGMRRGKEPRGDA
ncbi:hypothetical protein Tco_0747515 [Tanacetum coccineum]|uniref:Xylulose kinase-1 n=1 Tax=Tanacetum coccineum TaxID=301880 RepID=A0ABQ4YSY8_9ASTR